MLLAGPVASPEERSPRWAGCFPAKPMVLCGTPQILMPVGLQLLGPAMGEAAPLRVAAAYQRLTSHHEERAPEIV